VILIRIALLPTILSDVKGHLSYFEIWHLVSLIYMMLSASFLRQLSFLFL